MVCFIFAAQLDASSTYRVMVSTALKVKLTVIDRYVNNSLCTWNGIGPTVIGSHKLAHVVGLLCSEVVGVYLGQCQSESSYVHIAPIENLG
jgi:hypothetical protein